MLDKKLEYIEKETEVELNELEEESEKYIEDIDKSEVDNQDKVNYLKI